MNRLEKIDQILATNFAKSRDLNKYYFDSSSDAYIDAVWLLECSKEKVN